MVHSVYSRLTLYIVHGLLFVYELVVGLLYMVHGGHSLCFVHGSPTPPPPCTQAFMASLRNRYIHVSRSLRALPRAYSHTCIVYSEYVYKL